MTSTRSLLAAGFAALMIGGLAGSASAESAKSFMKKVNADADKTISMDELDAYAKKRFAEIEKDADKTLDQKELKGRLSEAGLAAADTDKDKTVDEAEFVAYANKLFEDADIHKKADSPGPSLSESELATPAGKKLIMMLR